MRKSAGVLASILLTAVTWVACSTGDTTSPTSPSLTRDYDPLAAQGTEKCEDFGTFTAKDSFGPPWSLTAPAGQVVAEVCVKAGPKAHVTGVDGTIFVNSTPCFVVSGIGTPTVTVTVAAGSVENICKGISHIEANFDTEPSPSPSPSPSPDPSPSPYP